MFTILFHSSKTMRAGNLDHTGDAQTPRYASEAQHLARYVGALPAAQIARSMNVSLKLAETTQELMQAWAKAATAPAIDTFVGDMYSGLQAHTFDAGDRDYANQTLVVFSGLYGALKPLDSIAPYRLEMNYTFPDAPYTNLYDFWGDKLAQAVPRGRTIINVSSLEYTKTVFPYLPGARIITPKFLSIGSKSGDPIFVTVHTKIARGAFTHWLITQRIEDEAELQNFTKLGYAYDPALSTELEPVFVAREFGGIGLSVRLT